MLKWTQILQHQGLLERLERLCEAHGFPIEVRQYLHEWIEEQPWSLLDPNNPAHEPRAMELLQMTLTKLRSKVLELNSNFLCLPRTRLEHACTTFQKYQHNALGFLRIMKLTLEQETVILQSLIAQENGAMEVEPYSSMKMEHLGMGESCMVVSQEQQITNKLQDAEALKERIKTLGGRIVDNKDFCDIWFERFYLEEQSGRLCDLGVQAIMPMEQEEVGGRPLNYHQQFEWAATQHNELSASIELKTSRLQEQYQLRMELGELFGQALETLPTVHYHVVTSGIPAWKHTQQLASNGTPPAQDPHLERLQNWCESLAEVLLVMHGVAQRLVADPNNYSAPSPLCGPSVIDDPKMLQALCCLNLYSEPVKDLLRSLLASALVLERQPEQVVQQQTYFNATVRLLVSRTLKLSNLPTVEASILTEEEARQWSRDWGRVKTQSVNFKLLDNKVRLEYQKTSNTTTDNSPPSSSAAAAAADPLCANFRMQFKVDGSRHRRGQERVTKMKWCFKFQSSLNVEGIPVDLQVVSLPVVLTVHCTQKSQAVATILWDNAFALPHRELFEVPLSVPWSQRVETLLQVFCEKQTGRPLKPYHLQFLADKIFGCQGCNTTSAEVTLSQFCEIQLKDHWCQIREKKKGKRRCTFWDWFYDAIRVIKLRLNGMWQDGYIEGFVSKAQAQNMLQDQADGTFLFRFSDSECGALSIAFVEINAGVRVVKHTEPVDLDNINIADKIRGPNRLTILYPGIPKDKALVKHYTTPEDAEPNRRHPYEPFNNIFIPSLSEDLTTVDVEEMHRLFVLSEDDNDAA